MEFFDAYGIAIFALVGYVGLQVLTTGIQDRRDLLVCFVAAWAPTLLGLVAGVNHFAALHENRASALALGATFADAEIFCIMPVDLRPVLIGFTGSVILFLMWCFLFLWLSGRRNDGTLVHAEAVHCRGDGFAWSHIVRYWWCILPAAGLTGGVMLKSRLDFTAVFSNHTPDWYFAYVLCQYGMVFMILVLFCVAVAAIIQKRCSATVAYGLSVIVPTPAFLAVLLLRVATFLLEGTHKGGVVSGLSASETTAIVQQNSAQYAQVLRIAMWPLYAGVVTLVSILECWKRGRGGRKTSGSDSKDSIS